MAYTPPVSPNVNLNFITTPYSPPVSPNVVMNFGVAGGGGSGAGSGTIQSNFFLLLT